MKNKKYYVKVKGDTLLGTEIVHEEYTTSSIRKIRKELRDTIKDDWKMSVSVCDRYGMLLFEYDKCTQIYIDNTFAKEASKILK